MNSSELKNLTYPYQLPSLPYPYNALEPYIDAQTMEIHHTKHHQGYVTSLNTALEGVKRLQKKTLEELLLNLKKLPKKVQTPIRNFGGGHYNHSLFWVIMKQGGGGEPKGKLKEAIEKTFGSFEKFKELFTQTAVSHFGSGWAWLSLKGKKLVVHSTPNQDSPLIEGLYPIMGIDVWEHAYYLKYQNRRKDYVENWWNVVNWEEIEKRYLELTEKKKK
jgi:Fe-Mn family superoxide dismutase